MNQPSATSLSDPGSRGTTENSPEPEELKGPSAEGADPAQRGGDRKAARSVAWRLLRWSAIGVGGGVLMAVLIILVVDFWIHQVTRTSIYEKIDHVPEREVGLVLGTSPKVSTGENNLHFQRRVDAAAELYHAGKVKRLLLSGSNPSLNYNEPLAMYQALERRGVSKEDMTLDFAGYRTLDSVVRAKKVFGLGTCTLITDKFHTYRGVFLARHHGLEAIAFAAEDIPLKFSLRSKAREKLANLKAVLDIYVLDTPPRFLGDPEPMRGEEKGSIRPASELPIRNYGE